MSAAVLAEVERFGSQEALAERGAALFTEAAAAAARDGRFRVALAGGVTPTFLYRRLASAPWSTRVPWKATDVFFGDERCVPASSPERNDRAARAAFLGAVPIPAESVHPIAAQLEDGAERYERLLRETFASPDGEIPRFDLVLLGLGPDGHTASLFPGRPELEEKARLVVRVTGAPKPPPDRITMTLPLFNRARLVVFLASGQEKAPAVARAVAGDVGLPAGRVSPAEGRLVWLLDEAASSGLEKGR